MGGRGGKYLGGNGSWPLSLSSENLLLSPIAPRGRHYIENPFAQTFFWGKGRFGRRGFAWEPIVAQGRGHLVAVAVFVDDAVADAVDVRLLVVVPGSFEPRRSRSERGRAFLVRPDRRVALALRVAVRDDPRLELGRGVDGSAASSSSGGGLLGGLRKGGTAASRFE